MAFQRTHTHPVLSLGICRSYARSDIGLRRKVNQDAFLTDDTLGLYVVADGMGGHAAGEVASREAVDTVYGMVKRGLETMPDLRGPLAHDRVRAACRLLEGAVQAATYMVFALAELDRDKHGMGTTISAVLVLGDFAITAQVGDSRIYLLRDFRATQLTEDHTLINWQIREGLITPEEAKRSPNKNVITRAVGNRDYVQVDTGPVSVSKGDRMLLCSDGLHGYLKENEIMTIGSQRGEDAVRAFVDLANERGGKDNITAVLVEVI
jgi:serine/threonine protein phosphatase PrpC